MIKIPSDSQHSPADIPIHFHETIQFESTLSGVATTLDDSSVTVGYANEGIWSDHRNTESKGIQECFEDKRAREKRCHIFEMEES